MKKIYVDVCGIPFELKEIESNGRDDGAMGRCDAKMGVISINKEQPVAIKECTLIHEWLHGVLDNNGLPEQSGNETLICVLAAELYRNGFRIKQKEM